MGPQLRPRRHFVLPDHNYSAPYPNSIYTPSKPILPPVRLNIDESLLELTHRPLTKAQKLVKTVKTVDINGKRVKRKHRYFGDRRRKRFPKAKRVNDDNIENEVAKVRNVKRRRTQKLQNVGLVDNGTDFDKHNSDLLANDDVSICKSCGFKIISTEARRHSQRLVIKNFKLPFDKLPDLCKLKIFSLLSVPERGRVALVCQEWRRLIRHSGLWTQLDFGVFNPPLSYHLGKVQYPWFMTVPDYEWYRLRVQKYISFLQSVVPHTRSLSFAYDIHNPKDAWLKQILCILQNSNCRTLERVDLDWTCTPVRPPCADKYCCFFNKARLALQRHLQRIRSFHKLLEELTRAAPKVTYAAMPFDWSERSVLLMCRWKRLTVLKLGAYSGLRLVNQDVLDALLSNLPLLQELRLSISFPLLDSIDERNMFRISHSSIQTLDLRGCKRIHIHSLNLPALKVIYTADREGREQGTGDRTLMYPPCLYSVLRHGAPNLRQVNDHFTQPYWLEFLYRELESVFTEVCPCKLHSLGIKVLL